LKTKIDKLPTDYPRHADRAALVGLATVLDPHVEVVEISMKNIDSKSTKEVTSNGGWKIVSRDRHATEVEMKFNGLNTKGTRIERTLPFEEVLEIVYNQGIEEAVIETKTAIFPARNDCPVCDKFGIETLLSKENKKHGQTRAWMLDAESPAKYMKQKIEEYGVLYLPELVSSHLRSMLVTDAINGSTGTKILPGEKFLPYHFGRNVVDRLQMPWVDGKFWKDMLEPDFGCGPTYMCRGTGKYFGAKP
jgi:hypothetical protein